MFDFVGHDSPDLFQPERSLFGVIEHGSGALGKSVCRVPVAGRSLERPERGSNWELRIATDLAEVLLVVGHDRPRGTERGPRESFRPDPHHVADVSHIATSVPLKVGPSFRAVSM